MQNMGLNYLNWLIIIGLLLIVPLKADAYIDAGSGSIILQMILAVIFGSLVGIKIFWKKIISFLKKIFTKKKSDDQTRIK